jgi:hypothetical protein
VSATGIVVDESRWPKVYVIWPHAAVSDEEFQRAVGRLSGYVDRGEHYVIIHDARIAVRPTPTQRAYAAEQQKRTADLAGRWLVGAAIVVSNPLTAGVVRAINWLAPPTYPQRIFSSLPEAEAWAEQQLR